MKNAKNPTLNYPKDNHAAFCKRCMKKHGKCPITKNHPSAKCGL